MLDCINGLKLPDYKGLTVSIHDSCSFRQKPQVHSAVRSILRKMNIKIIKSEYSRAKPICCGDNLYSKIQNEKVIELQEKRTAQMPCNHVAAYCIGCVHSMTTGGKQPLHLPNFVFGHETKVINRQRWWLVM